MIDLDHIGAPAGDVSIPDLLELHEGLMPHVERPDDAPADPAAEPLDGQAESFTLPMKYLYRRAFSEMELLDSLQAPGFRFRKGMCYNFLTRGDVDALSFFKAVVRQQHIFDVVVATWCVDMNDILTIRKWILDGRIDRMDLFLGEIYRTGRHGFEVHDFEKALEGLDGVTVTVARNHSKVFAGHGCDFDFVIQTSANINTNPRIESACILIPDDGGELVNFYLDFYKTVKSL